MFYQILGYVFGLVMAINYYLFFVFFPCLIGYLLGDD
ncbi:MAG: hypothetical protein BWY02_01410 [bacterium ADurb.Bin157]|jgi:hypothetical protein|nr:MAG: hypothetical protein BWY02_01410 [bacterium ADurb.Bin157]